jgi:hypothetical protein
MCQIEIPPSVKCILLFDFSTRKEKLQLKFIIRLFCVYGDDMNRQYVAKWCHEFNAGRTDIHDEQRTDRPSLIVNDLVQKVE